MSICSARFRDLLHSLFPIKNDRYMINKYLSNNMICIIVGIEKKWDYKKNQKVNLSMSVKNCRFSIDYLIILSLICIVLNRIY
jgi:hypothetical protein